LLINAQPMTIYLIRNDKKQKVNLVFY